MRLEQSVLLQVQLSGPVFEQSWLRSGLGSLLDDEGLVGVLGLSEDLLHVLLVELAQFGPCIPRWVFLLRESEE